MIRTERIIRSPRFEHIFTEKICKKIIQDFLETGHFLPFDDVYDPNNLDRFNKDGTNNATGTLYCRLGVQKDELWSCRNLRNIGTNLTDRDGFYLGIIDAEGIDKNGYKVTEYRNFLMDYCVIKYPAIKPNDINKNGFTRNGYGPNGENRYGFLKTGFNIYTNSIKDTDGYYYSGYNDDGLDRNGNSHDSIDVAKEYFQSDSITLQSYCYKYNLNSLGIAVKVRDAIRKVPSLAINIEDTASLININAIKKKKALFTELLDGKLDIEETVGGTNPNDIYLNLDQLGTKVISKCISFMKKIIDDPKRLSKFLTGNELDIEKSILILKYLDKNIKLREPSFMSRAKSTEIKNIIVSLKGYQGKPDILLDTTVYKNGKSFHFTNENIIQICNILRENDEIICPKTITDYAFNTL